MWTLKVCKKVGFKKPCSFVCEHLRYLSTEESVLAKCNQTAARRYSKPVLARNLKPLKENFLGGLFCDSVDKEIFQYPAVLQSSNIDIVLDQTSELEKFLSNNSKSKLTEDIVSKLNDLELFGLSTPQEYGGAGYTHTESIFLHECTGVNPSIARFLGYQSLGCKLLELYGTKKQKEKYLTKLATGSSLMSIAYLENCPLVDVMRFQGHSIFMERKNEFLLNCEKKWVHNADRADLFLVMAKNSFLDDAAGTTTVKFNMFIVDRDSPGISIEKVKFKNLDEYDLYDVTFKDVLVPSDNLLGGVETDGFVALKSSLSHNNLIDSALCCCIIKQIIHHVIQFITEKDLNDADLRSTSLQQSVSELSTYAFGLESLIYLVAGRYDLYEKPDLFSESILVKSLAIDILQTVIKKYIAAVGRESFKSSGILEQALQSLHYYSVFEENIEHLRMAAAAEGLEYAGPKLSKKVKIFRNPLDNLREVTKAIFTKKEKYLQDLQLKHQFKMELCSELCSAADVLERNCAILQLKIEILLTEHGRDIENNDHYFSKLTEVASYLYATMACLSRASNSLCYNFEGYENDLHLALCFTVLADSKISSLVNESLKYFHLNEYYRILGKTTFSKKEYPAEHPLTRTF